MKLSIVIPVYNGEKYLKQAFNNLARQTCKEFEAIFVNDGSKDETQSVFKMLHDTHSEIDAVMYSQENKGVSAARNRGILKATGDVISFCDVDDIIHPDYVAHILNGFQTSNRDLIFFRFVRCMDRDPQVDAPSDLCFSILEKRITIEKFLYKTFVSGCWSCAVKTDVIRKNNICYDVKTRYSEDLNFVWKLLLCSETMGYIDNPLYYYIVQPISAMSQFDERRLDGYRAAIDLFEFVREKDPEFAPLYERFEGPRLLWSIAWQAAVKLSRKQFGQYFEGVPLRKAMAALLSFPSRSVRLSARIYLISPELFRMMMRLLGRNKCS